MFSILRMLLLFGFDGGGLRVFVHRGRRGRFALRDGFVAGGGIAFVGMELQGAAGERPLTGLALRAVLSPCGPVGRG